jgi:hypothetical protein
MSKHKLNCQCPFHKNKNGQNNPFFGRKHTKKTLKKQRIIKLGKICSEETKRKIGLKSKGHTLSMDAKKRIGEKNRRNLLGRKLSLSTREKMSKSIANHHIYLKENSTETIKMKNRKHRQLHARAYDYIYVKYGKEGIDDYLKWFFSKFGGN